MPIEAEARHAETHDSAAVERHDERRGLALGPRAASAVRTFANVAAFMPKKPARSERNGAR